MASPDQKNRDAFRSLYGWPEPAPSPGTTTGGSTSGSTSGGTRTASTSSTGEVTPEERAAARNLGSISGFNAQSTRDQFDRALDTYDLSDAQNRALANTQLRQHSRTAADDRFAQAKRMQASASGLLSAAGNAMQGSTLGALIDMLRTRTDLDNNEMISTLKQNKDSVWNALQEALNTNVIARNTAADEAEFALRGIEADTAAQLNNIDPNLFVAPGTGAASANSAGFAKAHSATGGKPTTSGYYIPSNGQTNVTQPTQMQGGSSYFDRLLNSYNGRVG